MKFTFEEERLLNNLGPTTSILSFLDVQIVRRPGIGFETTLYRKPSFSGLTTKWNSFVPKKYKYNAVSSVAYRATRICSTYEASAEEFDKIHGISARFR